MSIVIVTATGTGVGKTVVSAALAATALAAGRSVAVVKPAQTGMLPGEPGDLTEIAGLAGADCSLHELARYPDPLAPASAARLAGAPALTAAEVADYVLGLEHDLVIVEGAGGALVHLNDEGETLLDVTQLLRAAGAAVELVLVTRAGLGALHDAGAASLAIRTVTGADADHLVVGSWPE